MFASFCCCVARSDCCCACARFRYLAADLAKNPAREKAWAKVTDVVAWANESISYVINDVYRFHSGSTNNNLDDPALGDWYYQHNFPIAVQRMQGTHVSVRVCARDCADMMRSGGRAPGGHYQQHLRQLHAGQARAGESLRCVSYCAWLTRKWQPAHFQRSAEYVRQQLQKQKAQQRK